MKFDALGSTPHNPTMHQYHPKPQYHNYIPCLVRYSFEVVILGNLHQKGNPAKIDIISLFGN